MPVTPLASFEPVTDAEVSKILSCCPTKASSLDPIPTWLLKQLSHLFVPVIRRLCNLSLETGFFPRPTSMLLSFLISKKPNLDPDSQLVQAHFQPLVYFKTGRTCCRQTIHVTHHD